MPLDRRSLLKSLAAAGRRRGRASGTAEARGRAGRAARRAGPSLRHDALHRLQGLRRGVPRGERHEARNLERARRPLGHADGPGRPDEDRHQALQERRRTRPLVLQGAVHALRRPGLHERVHARRAEEEGARDRLATTRTSASAAATARWPARSTFRSSSGRRPRRRSSSASSAAIAWQGAALRHFGRVQPLSEGPRSGAAPKSAPAQP